MAWLRDLAHNPDPLSPAQVDLVERVVSAGLGRQRVVDGELYYWEDDSGAAPAESIDLGAAEAAVEALRAAAFATTTIDQTFTQYVSIYQTYVECVRPAIRAVLRFVEEETLDQRTLLAGSAVQSCQRDQALWLLGQDPSEEKLSDYQQRFGMYSPVWDVAVAPDAERPDRVLAMAALWQGRTSPEARRQQACIEAIASLSQLGTTQRGQVALARRALALADADDVVFFAAQQRVRSALLRDGDPARLRIPLRLPSTSRLLNSSLRGVGWGQAYGCARVVRSLLEVPTDLSADTILIMPTFLPSHSFLLAIVRGIVVETGGLLSHVAQVAREYGVPHLVGCHNATAIANGTNLFLDGSLGSLSCLSTTDAPAALPASASDDSQ